MSTSWPQARQLQKCSDSCSGSGPSRLSMMPLGGLGKLSPSGAEKWERRRRFFFLPARLSGRLLRGDRPMHVMELAVILGLPRLIEGHPFGELPRGYLDPVEF